MKNIKNTLKNTGKKLAGIGSVLSVAMVPGIAMAQDGMLSGVGAIVEGYKTEVLAAIALFIVAAWTLKATGILRPRG